MIAYHPQLSEKHFGPPSQLRSAGLVQVFHMRIVHEGVPVNPLVNLARRERFSPLCEVELGCGSLQDYERDVYPVIERVPYLAERAEVRAAWTRLFNKYEDAWTGEK